MRVLVCGGRDDCDCDYVEKTLDRLLVARGPFEKLIHGDARGVDRMAGNWAREHGILVWDFLPEWHRVEAEDGLSRNQRMIEVGSPTSSSPFPAGRARNIWSGSRRQPTSRSSKFPGRRRQDSAASDRTRGMAKLPSAALQGLHPASSGV